MAIINQKSNQLNVETKVHIPITDVDRRACGPLRNVLTVMVEADNDLHKVDN